MKTHQKAKLPAATTGLRAMRSCVLAADDLSDHLLSARQSPGLPLQTARGIPKLPRAATADVGSILSSFGRLCVTAPLPARISWCTASRQTEELPGNSRTPVNGRAPSSNGSIGRRAARSSLQVRPVGHLRSARRRRSEPLTGLLATAPAAITLVRGSVGQRSTAAR